MMIRVMDAQVDADEAPPELKEKPELLGQFLSKIVPGYAVYLLGCGELSGPYVHFKVGIAEDVGKRVHAIQGQCPLIINRVFYFLATDYSEAFQVEQKMLKQLNKVRTVGEWLIAFNRKKQEYISHEFVSLGEKLLADDPALFTYNPLLQDSEYKDVENYLCETWEIALARVEINLERGI